MKKILTILGILLLFLSSCGNPWEEDEENPMMTVADKTTSITKNDILQIVLLIETNIESPNFVVEYPNEISSRNKVDDLWKVIVKRPVDQTTMFGEDYSFKIFETSSLLYCEVRICPRPQASYSEGN